MNKILLLQLPKLMLRLSFKLLVYALKLALTVFFNSDLDKRIKAHNKWESDYDEHTAHVTKRKYLH